MESHCPTLLLPCQEGEAREGIAYAARVHWGQGYKSVSCGSDVEEQAKLILSSVL